MTGTSFRDKISVETEHIWKPTKHRLPSYDFDNDKDILKRQKTKNVIKLLFGNTEAKSSKSDSGHDDIEDLDTSLKSVELNSQTATNPSVFSIDFDTQTTLQSSAKEFIPKSEAKPKSERPSALSLKPSQRKNFVSKPKSKLKTLNPAALPCAILPVYTAYNYYQPVMLENGNVVYSVNRLYLHQNRKSPWFPIPNSK